MGDRKETYEITKDLGPGLNDVRNVESVRDFLLRNVYSMIKMMRSGNMTDEQIRSALSASEVPTGLIEEALQFS